MYKGALSIFEQPIIPQPIIPRTKNELQELFNSTAKLERLSLKSINDNPPTKDRYFLEPIPSEMFLLFADSESTKVEYNDSPHVLKLISTGSLSVDNDEAPDEEQKDNVYRAVVTPYSLNLEEYRRRRAEQNNVIDLSHSLTNTQSSTDSTLMIEAGPQEAPSTPAQFETSVALVEEFAPKTQDVNDMIEDILGPNSSGAHSTVDVPTTEHNTLVTPVVNTEPTVAVAPPVVSAPPAVAAPPVVSAPPAVVAPPVVSAPPAPPVATVPLVVTEQPVVTEPQVQTEPAAHIEPPPPTAEASKIFTNDWISEEEIAASNDDTSANSQFVYTFPTKIIPVYPTMDQRSECDKTTEASRTKTNLFFNMHFEKSIGTLNLPSSNVDYTPEEQWNVSGKLMVLKRLFNSLLDKDLVLLIVVKDMGEEEMLMELIKDNLKLDCVRMNYVIQDWEGEYGIFVKTKSQVDQHKGTAERGSSFEAVADFIIALDIRVKSDEALMKIVTKRNSSDLPPTACLISLGSVEERAFNFLEERKLLFSDSKSDAFKDLLRQHNAWPEDDGTYSIQELNILVAENVKSWLLSPKRKEDHYQYRSLSKLPRSIASGVKKTKNTAPTVAVPVVVAAEDTGSDMEIEEEDSPEEAPLLSKEGTEFIKNNLFPPFDISKGELPNIDTAPLLPLLPESDLRKFRKLPPLMRTQYQEEVNKLKRRYEEAFQELQNQFREKAFTALREQ